MLHSQTTLILAALLFLVLPLLMGWATAGRRNAALLWWCGGSLLVGLALVLMGLRSWLPYALAYHLPNTMLLTGMMLWPQSLRVMLGRGWRLRWIILGVVLAALYYSVLFSEFSPNTRGIGIRAALSSLALYTAAVAAQVATRMHSHNAWAISACYLALCVGLLGHMLLIGGGGGQPNPFSNTWDASALAMLTLFTSAVGHLCITGMVLDASIQEQVKAVRARTAAEETVRLETQLRLMDRQDRLVLVAGAVAHELNQPLSVALVQAQMAQRKLNAGAADTAPVADQLEQVGSALRRASAILDRIRTSTKVQGVMGMERLDLREVVQATMGLLAFEWRQHGVQVNLDLGPEPLWCKGDEVALSQVLINLLRNATEAAEPGTLPRLDIQATASAQEVQVLVRDHGQGVPAEVLDHWGAPFKTTRKHGLGLGLAISRSIAHQHQGRLNLRNHPQGGAEAVLALPLDTARAT